MSFVDNHQYLVAASFYVVAGIGFCVFWWRTTRSIKNRGWRDLLRGFALVIIYTPWYLGEEAGVYAPAIFVLLMDLMLQQLAGGLPGGMALLFACFLMLIVLTVRQFRHTRPKRV